MSFFSLHGGVFGLIENFVRFGVIILFFTFFFIHIKKFITIKKSLEADQIFFDQIDPRDLASSFPDIEQRMASNKLTSHLWRDFDRTLVKSGQNVSTTVESDFYFNEYVLVDIPMKMEFVRNIPGILTSLGIVGTFVGVLAGLQGFDSQNLEAVRESVKALLGGVRGAFLNSFMAIFLAVIFTFFEKSTISLLYDRVTKLQRSINRVFNRSISDDYLNQMVFQMQEQTQSLKAFSQDLAESINRTMTNLLDQQTSAMKESNGQLVNTLSSAMTDQIAPVMNKLGTTIEQVRQDQESSSRDAMRQIVDQFQTTLTNSASKQLDEMMGAISGTTDIMSSLKLQLGDFVTSVKEQATAQQEVMQKHLKMLSDKSADEQLQTRQELAGFIEKISGALQQVQNELTERSVSSVERVGLQLESLVTRANQHNSDSIEQLSSLINNLQAETEARLSQMTQEITRAAGESTENLNQVVAETISKIQSETKALLSASGEINQELGGRLHQMAELIEHLTKRTTDATTQLTEKLSKGSENITALVKQVESLTSSLAVTLGESKNLTGELVAGAGTLVKATNEISGVVQEFRKVQQSNEAFTQRFDLQIKNADEQFRNLQQLMAEYRRSADIITGTVDKNSEVIKGLEETIEEGLVRYIELTKNSLGQYLGDMENAMKTSVKSLGGVVEELSENLEELSTIVERTLNRKVAR